MTDLVLVRDIFTLKMTLGQLFYKGEPLFVGNRKIYVGEDVARPNGVKIDKETAIWEGDYFISMTFSNRFQKIMPLIYNEESTLRVISGMKYFEGVRIHHGNSSIDTEACLLLGLNRDNNGVYHSNDAINLFFPFLTTLIEKEGGKIAFKIINQQL